jgi:hypothetical protein
LEEESGVAQMRRDRTGKDIHPGADRNKAGEHVNKNRIHHYWAYFVACYFSPYAALAVDDMEAEGANIPLGDLLHKLQIEDKEIVCVPESFQVLPGQVAAVECEKMLVREDSIAFTAIPKHASFRVHTVEIPLPMLEAALAISPSTTQA